MISVDSVYGKLDILIAKAQSLQTVLGATGSNGHNSDLEARSVTTLYGLPDAIAEVVDTSIASLAVAEQKVLSLY